MFFLTPPSAFATLGTSRTLICPLLRLNFFLFFSLSVYFSIYYVFVWVFFFFVLHFIRFVFLISIVNSGLLRIVIIGERSH